MSKKRPKRTPPGALRVGCIEICEPCKGEGRTRLRIDDVVAAMVNDKDFGQKPLITHSTGVRVDLMVKCLQCDGHGTVEP